MRGQIRKRLLVLSLVLVCLLGAGLLVRYCVLENDRQEALAKLEQNVGRYDERSIVLYDTSRSRAEALAELYGAQLRITQDGSFARLTLPEGKTIRDVFGDQQSLTHIDEMAADYQVSISETQDEEARLPARPQFSVSDTDYELQTYLDYLNMGTVWETSQGRDITVAVIDTGIDTDHPEFAGRISEYSYNATEDKVVKDHGWQLIEDQQGHGTAVAGVIAAAMDGAGTVGIAPNAELLVIKADCDADGNFYRTSDLVFGLYYAIERSADVVNMSFGSNISDGSFEAAVQLAYDSDVICVAAAGNNGTSALHWPAAYEKVIGVGALGEGWTLSEYSNYGENTNLVAPGNTYTTAMGGGYKSVQGTSFASPIVAGAIALLLNQEGKYIENDRVTELLYASCYDLGDLGRDWEYGFGALDVEALVLGKRGTVTFDMLTDEVEDEERTFILGNAIQELPEPERLYAVFDGWYYDDSFTQEYQYYEDAFNGDLTLYAKWVNEDDGIPYTYVVLEDGTVEIRSYTGRRRFIAIPDKIEGKTVSSIGEFAFQGQTRLRQVQLPSGLKRIRQSAFENCSNLTQIHIPSGVTEIGENAFKGAVRLRSVSFASGSKLTAIGNFAFSDCSSLERVELPASVSEANGAMFCGAVSLKHIGVAAGSKRFSSKDGVLFNAAGDTLEAYPAAKGSSYSIPSGTTAIGNYAFAYAKLETVELSGVKSIGNGAFINSTLRSLTLPDSVTKVGGEAFANNTRLSQVQLGNGLTELSKLMFDYCTSLEQITIPACVKTIGSGAFRMSSLSILTFAPGSTLETIGDCAFEKNMPCPTGSCKPLYAPTALSKVEIPASVTIIGDSAFKRAGLQDFSFAEGSKLQQIGEEAFFENPNLTAVSLPEGLESIGSQAFWHCDLAEVTLPASLVTLGGGAFGRNYNLTAIQAAQDNTAFHAVDGVLFSKDDTLLHTFPSGKSFDNYQVPGTVREIVSYGFAGTWKLQGVTVPEGFQVLGDYAFYDAGIVTLSLPASLTEIGEYAIAGCASLGGVSVPDNVVKLGRYAFADSGLETITFGSGSKLPRIGAYAFASSGIRQLTIPASVSSMAQYAFAGCDELESVTFAGGSKLASISAYMFDGCSSLSSLTFLPGSSLTSVQAHGLEGMEKLAELNFGDAKLTEIGNFAFRFCTRLESIALPQTLTSIGRYAFYGCKSLEELTVPEAVEHIGGYAFLGTKDLQLYLKSETMPAYLDEGWDQSVRGYYSGVSSVKEQGQFKVAVLTSGDLGILEYMGSEKTVDLTKTDLGAPVTVIGGGAFRGKGITSIVLPDTLTTIQAGAFADSALTAITIPANVEFIGREAFRATPLKTLTIQAGSRLNTVEQYAFAETSQLGAVSLPVSLTVLGTGAFLESGIKEVSFAPGIALETIPRSAFEGTKLTSVALPDSVTLVDHNAFSNVQTLKSLTFGSAKELRLMSGAFYRTGLESLNIPANVTYIGEYCFSALGNLMSFAVDASNPNYSAADGLLLNKSGSKLIAAPAGRTGSLTIPAGVEEIGFGAFEESKLATVTLPQNGNLLTIGSRAFFQMANLKEIVIPASVVSVDYYAFGYCESLQKVTFASGSRLTGIYEGAFCGDTQLTSIDLPDTVVEISDFAFYGCENLDQIPAGEGLKGIYDYAFAYAGLEGEQTVPGSVIHIGEYAFLGINATSVTVPDDSRMELVIGLGAFEECQKLEKITLPFIGASFENEQISWFSYIFGVTAYSNPGSYIPKSLRDVVITEGITFIGRGGFAGIPSPIVIHLPHSITKIEEAAFSETFASYRLTNDIDISGDYEDGFAPSFSYNLSGKLTLAEGLTSLYAGCLQQSGITELILPDSLTAIEAYAATDSKSLTAVHIPRGVTSIGEEAFYGNEKLEIVYNDSDLPLVPGSEEYGYVAAYANVVIDRNGNRTYRPGFENVEYLDTPDGFRFRVLNGSYTLIAYVGNEVEVTLPDKVNGEEYSIDRVSGITRLVIPESWTEVPNDIFSGNTNLFRVTFHDGITQIGAFQNCIHLNDISLPDSMTTFNASAFYGCYYLDNIDFGSGVKEITGTFGDHPNLKHVTLPANLEQLGYSVFNPRYLESISISSSNPNFRIIDGVLYNGDCTSIIAVPKTVKGTVTIPEGVTNIEGYKFSECKDLKLVRIPASVQFIDTGAFPSGCAVEIAAENPNFCLWNDILFDKDMTRIVHVSPNITGEVVIPDTVTEIPTYAFENRTGITAVTIHGSVRYIGMDAFLGCTGLKKLTLKNGVETISSNAFRDCSALEEITVPGSVKQIDSGVFFGCSALKKAVLEEGITEVSGNMFHSCKALNQVVLPSTLEAIGPSAFTGCTNLQTITLPSGLTSIGESAFSRSGLRELMIPNSVTVINNAAFFQCRSLEKISLPASLKEVPERSFEGCSSLKSVEIPEGITCIGSQSFYKCDSLEQISLPASLKEIRENGFGECVRLKTVVNRSSLKLEFESETQGCVAFYAETIMDGNGGEIHKTSVQDNSFLVDGFRFVEEGSTYVLLGYEGPEESVTLPQKVNGRDYLIRFFYGAKYVTLPEGMTEVPTQAFAQCGTLLGVTIPDTVRTIGSEAFKDTSLRSVRIPDSVTHIGGSAFMNCLYLTDIVLSESLAYIGSHAFYGVDLSNVKIPETARYIGTGNWVSGEYTEDGMLVRDGWLLHVPEDTRYMTDLSQFRYAVEGLYWHCSVLKNILWNGGPVEGSNVETVLVGTIPKRATPINQTATLKNIVILDTVKPGDLANLTDIFTAYDLSGVTIFVEGLEEDYQWDDNFPGWSNGNQVLYGDEWAWTTFYDENGEVLSYYPRRISEVIRRPAGNQLSDNFVGWDLDGDGAADPIPAAMSGDVVARAVTGQHTHSYTETVTEPTCTEEGYTTYTCRCGDSYTDQTVAALGHAYENGKCTVCGEEKPDTGVLGDASGDDKVDYMDAMLVLRHAVKLATLSEEAQARCNVDGKGGIDYMDAMLILRHAVKLIDKFPVTK